MTLSITKLCHYAERHYAECHVLFTIMLNVIMTSVIMMSVVAPIDNGSCLSLNWPRSQAKLLLVVHGISSLQNHADLRHTFCQCKDHFRQLQLGMSDLSLSKTIRDHNDGKQF
jgi:hypothetical protein